MVFTGMQDTRLTAHPTSRAWKTLAEADKQLEAVQGKLEVDVTALYEFAIETGDLDAFALASVGYRVIQKRSSPTNFAESA
jgi:hypothetical protein